MDLNPDGLALSLKHNVLPLVSSCAFRAERTGHTSQLGNLRPEGLVIAAAQPSGNRDGPENQPPNSQSLTCSMTLRDLPVPSECYLFKFLKS